MSVSPANSKLVTLYSHITIWCAVYGILAAHVPFIIGIPWTTCDNCSSKLGCVLLFHLFEIPLILLNFYIAWYGLKRFSQTTLNTFISLLGSAFAANLVFLCFECFLIYTSLRSFAPGWENILLGTVALVLTGGCALALYVKQTLIQST